MEAKGSKVMPELKYTKTNEWARVEGGTAVVGLTDFAQHEMTDIVFAEVPKIGAMAKQGTPLTSVESVKAVSDFVSPVSGEVVKVNPDLENQPELMNKEPYGKGWMAVIKMSNPKELDNLLNAEAYVKFLETEYKAH
jgi:glycine cleavage system H protein